MPPVGVIVDVVIAAPEENGIVVVAHVLVGQQNIAGQRAEEGVHFAVESVMELLQKSIVVLLLFRQAASFAVGGELFRKSFFQERIVFPCVTGEFISDEGVFVEQVDRDELRILPVCQFRMGIDVVEEVGGEPLEVLPGRRMDKAEHLVFDAAESPAAASRDVSGTDGAGDEEIGCDIDAAFFKFSQKEVQLRHRVRIERGAAAALVPPDDPVVEVVNAEQIVPPPGQVVRNEHRMFGGRDVGLAADIGAPETNRFPGMFFPNEFVVVGDHPAECSGGGLVEEGEIEQGSALDFFVGKRLEFRRGLDGHRLVADLLPLFDSRQRWTVGKGDRGDHPDRCSSAGKGQPGHRLLRQLERSGVERNPAGIIFAAPSGFRFGNRLVSPEVFRVDAGRHGEGVAAAVAVLHPDVSRRGAPVDPGAAVEQVEVAVNLPVSRQSDREGFRQPGTLPAAQYDGCPAGVLSFVENAVEDTVGVHFTGREQPHVVFFALIGPAAPAVVSRLVAESHIHDSGEVNRNALIRDEAESQFECPFLKHFPIVVKPETEGDGVGIPVAVVLNLQADPIRLDVEGSCLQHQYDFAEAEGEGGPFLFPRAHFAAVAEQTGLPDKVQRQPGGERDKFRRHSAGGADCRGKFQRLSRGAAQLLPEREGAAGDVEFSVEHHRSGGGGRGGFQKEIFRRDPGGAPARRKMDDLESEIADGETAVFLYGKFFGGCGDAGQEKQLQQNWQEMFHTESFLGIFCERFLLYRGFCFFHCRSGRRQKETGAGDHHGVADLMQFPQIGGGGVTIHIGEIGQMSGRVS